MEGNVDAFTTLEGDGGGILVEKGLEDDDFVARLDESGKGCELAFKREFISERLWMTDLKNTA